MEVTDKISVSVGVTRNLGDYNNIKPEAGYETTVRLGETVEQAYERAWKVVEAQIETKITEAIEELERA